MARRVAEAVAGLMPHAGWTLRIIDADEPGHRYRGDAFIALHGDASASPQAGGASVGYRTPEGQALAQAWKQSYARHGWPFGWRNDNYTAALSGYYGHRIAVQQGNPRACIVEHGFMTNPRERAWIDSPDGTRAAALAVVEAVTGSLPGPSGTMSIGAFMQTLTEREQKNLKALAGVNPAAVEDWARQAGASDREMLGRFAKEVRAVGGLNVAALADLTGKLSESDRTALRAFIRALRVETDPETAARVLARLVEET